MSGHTLPSLPDLIIRIDSLRTELIALVEENIRIRSKSHDLVRGILKSRAREDARRAARPVSMLHREALAGPSPQL